MVSSRRIAQLGLAVACLIFGTSIAILVGGNAEVRPSLPVAQTIGAVQSFDSVQSESPAPMMLARR